MNPALSLEPLFSEDRERRKDPRPIPLFRQFGEERIYRFEASGGLSRGEVLFIHGLTDHPGRHFTTARMISAIGFGVTLFDLAGHGGRQEPPGRSEQIYRAYALSDEASVVRWAIGAPSPSDFFPPQFAALQGTRIRDHQRQIDRLLRDLLPELAGNRELPVYLVGFSMGGLLAADAAIRWGRSGDALGPNLKGAAFLSPAFRPQGRPSSRVENLVIDAAWSGRGFPFAPVRLMVKNALRLNVKMDTSWGAPYMSDEAEEVELYRQDPLVPKAVPSAYASSIESLMATVEAKATDFRVDTLFMFPGQDGITSLRGGLDFAHRVEAARGDRRCRILQYSGLKAHDLTRSSARGEVRRALLEWLEALG